MDIDFMDYGNQYDGFIIKYDSEEIQVKFHSTWQGFDYEIFVNGERELLSDFEIEYKNILACSKTNLEYTLSAFKRFVDSKNIA